MNKSKKIFTVILVLLMAIGVGIVVWGFTVGFKSNNGLASDVLLNYGYIMVFLALLAIILGIFVASKSDPKTLVRLGIGLVAIAAFCGIVYAIAPGSPATGLVSVAQPTTGMLKLTDTVLYMAYILVAVAVVSIIVGDIRMSLVNRKG